MNEYEKALLEKKTLYFSRNIVCSSKNFLYDSFAWIFSKFLELKTYSKTLSKVFSYLPECCIAELYVIQISFLLLFNLYCPNFIIIKFLFAEVINFMKIAKILNKQIKWHIKVSLRPWEKLIKHS